MGLSPSDKLPKDIALSDAYAAIRSWYRTHIAEAEQRGDEYGRRSAELIRRLPEVSRNSDLEQRAIMHEVIAGLLEWAYHQSDGQFKMAAYAHAALDKHGGFNAFTPEERKQIEKSGLGPFLMK